MPRGDLMRKTITKALEIYEPQYDSFTAEDFLNWFKRHPTGTGGTRKIYPANANSMVSWLRKIDTALEVEGTYDPIRFVKAEFGSDPHSEEVKL